MKDLTRAFTRLMVVATSVICLIGTVLVTMDRFLFDILHAIFFPPLIERFVVQVVIFGGITQFVVRVYIFLHSWQVKWR